MITHRGGCHCGCVQFEVMAPEELKVILCNCSICSMTAYLHLLVPQSQFSLLTGWEAIQIYKFNTKVAKHYFCKRCGIKSFYVPRSHPEGYSINARCLEPETIKRIQISNFDGKNWELHAHELARLPKDLA